MTAPPTARRPRAGVRASTTSAPAELWILDEIGYGAITGADVLADLKRMNGGPVDVHINSNGGDVFQGIGAYEALRQHPGRVRVFVDGVAASIASVVAMAGDEVIVSPAGMFLVHDAWSMTVGNQADHLASAALLGQVSDVIAGVYAARTGTPAAEWRATMKKEAWFTSSEAVAAGLADRVAEAPRLSDPVARLHRDRARSAPSSVNVGAHLREALRASMPGQPFAGVPLAMAGAPARRPARRRPVPSAMGLIRSLKAAQA